KRDGTILALDLKLYQDVGAFNGFEMVCPTNTVNHLPTHYRIPSIRAEGWSILTNKTPVTPYRGAGRPEATFTMDRVLDLGARLRIDEDGKVRVSVGVNSQGQGHETTLAQICAEHLGAKFEDVEVKGGDTTLFPIGFGTAASRVLVNAGNAVFRSAVEVKRKV